MKSIFLSSVFLIFLVSGFISPFVLGLGYIWVDLVVPQRLAYSIINQMPLSFIIFIATFIAYILLDRKNIPKINGALVLLVLFTIWISMTTTWAFVPDAAFSKWNWAVKSVGFGIFVPFLFRSRVQIESAFAVINFSAASLYISIGIRTFIDGGGYGISTAGNTGLNESSTLSLICTMLIPINLYFSKNSLLFGDNNKSKILYYSLILFSTSTSIGTFARTGFVSMLALSVFLFLGYKEKRIRLLILMIIFALFISIIVPDAWISRMSTMESDTLDESALQRLAAWAWTLDFVADFPFGGGFDVYRINQGVYFGTEIRGRAFHNIFFEVLGEQGYLGLFLYLSLYIWVLINLYRLEKSTKNIPDLHWIYMLSRFLFMSFVVYAVGGLFVGIAYQPIFYYFLGLTISLVQHFNRYSQDIHRPRLEKVSVESIERVRCSPKTGQ